MKGYIAQSENGKVKTFNTQLEVKAYFELTPTGLQEAITRGTPVNDPDTDERYFLDEMLDDIMPTHEKIIDRDPSDDWD